MAIIFFICCWLVSSMFILFMFLYLFNAISVWNTVYLTEAIIVLKAKRDFDEDLIQHISPLGWEHINLLGEYKGSVAKFSDKLILR